MNTGRILCFINHSRKVVDIGMRYGWLPGATYENLRNVRGRPTIGFIDVNWHKYDFARHLEAVKRLRPLMTVAQDITCESQLPAVLGQAQELAQWSRQVIIVPKAPSLRHVLRDIPEQFILGYSVPTRYGSTPIPAEAFDRPVHLLGGRPDVQRRLADIMPVVSIDCNRFTYDAAFGDFFDGETFRPHPQGGYARCIEDSIANISALWDNYEPKVTKP